MTPKEKAIELVLKFKQRTHYVEVWHTPQLLDKFHHNAISCALIAVHEILELKETQEEYQIQYDNGEWSREIGYRYSKYWQEVKQEIEKL